MLVYTFKTFQQFKKVTNKKMLPIINRHINKRNGLVSTLFRTIQTSAQETPTETTVLHWANSYDLDDQRKFRHLIKAVVENDTSRKRIAQDDEIMKKLLQERAKRSRELKLEVIKQMPYAVFGWAQILSSLEAAIVLFLNANIATKSYKIGSLELLEGVVARAEDENKQIYEKIATFINTIECVLGVSLNSLLSLMLLLNRLKRNPAAHRNFSREDVKEATTILVAIDSNILTPSDPRLYVSHMMKNPHNCPILEEPEQRATLERITTVYMNALDCMGSFCYYFGLDAQKFEDEYDVVKDRDLKIVQTKLLAFCIDCQLRNKDVVRISKLVKEPTFFHEIKLPKGTPESSEADGE